MVTVEKSGKFLSGDYALKNNVSKIEILSEFDLKDTDFGKKLQGQVRCDDTAKSELTLTMNNTSKDAMIDTHGTNTKLWIGKSISIQNAKVSTQSGMKDTIFLKP